MVSFPTSATGAKRPTSACCCRISSVTLREHAIDSIAVYAGSGNVFAAFPVVEDPALTSIKAAVMYYGTANVQQFRLDLPVLYVRAGLDRPRRERVDRQARDAGGLAERAGDALELLGRPSRIRGGRRQRRDASGDRHTLEFVKRATSAPYQSALRASLPEATAAGYVQTGKFHEAAAAYAWMVAARPDDGRLRLAYGEALLAMARRRSHAASSTNCATRDSAIGISACLPHARACRKEMRRPRSRGCDQFRPQYLPPSMAEDPALPRCGIAPIFGRYLRVDDLARAPITRVDVE